MPVCRFIIASPLPTSSNPSPRADTSPAPRRWQTQPVHGSHHVLGFLITKDILNRPIYDKFIPLPDNPSERERESCFQTFHDFLPQFLPREYGLTNLDSVLVYVDKERMKMGAALVLADNRGAHSKQREPPLPDVVDKIADDLGLEGDAREPIWYKCVY
ncbi:hypothetical protein GLOTRDRAFT_126341 [Gloeophyllum trabeum ATCC 11539]|uniref:Uncharacterized protein n=1 Tax=Gloeophyllum trabeum (strain ATCC 11539 / FP-39264 / Madison 617) TaxID=670483 RepID=S7RWW4_GLOTA|nr:uncharacterized protein GLOTRDRAFT_126341 [Gloeophyllum trabeum ATCC 11539]EPQ57849.1 hypothetical protein GLOTRDRAFT_126341 [Gloeophyllum trabeum ATCC 11539]